MHLHIVHLFIIDFKMIQRIFIFLFFLILCSSILLSLVDLNKKIELTERRATAKKPSSLFEEKFIDKYNKYYLDNFGFRNLAISTYSTMKYNFLKISPYPNQVLIGKDDWLFLGNSKGSIQDEHSGINLLNQRKLKRIKSKILAKKKIVEQNGASFYLFIAPDKYSIYEEKLPDYINEKFINRNLDKLIEHLKPEIDVIDVRQDLIEKKEVNQLYAKGDSHWNDYGAYFAYQKIIRSIGEDFKDLKPLNLESFDIKKVSSKIKTTGDMINVSKNLVDFDIQIRKKGDLSWDRAEDQLIRPKYMAKSAKPYERRYLNQAPQTNLKILIFRDSFFNRLFRFFNEHFAESLYINNIHRFDVKLFKKEKPDIVLYEIIERDMSEYLINF